MSVTTDILATWRRPAAVFGSKLAQGPREDRALAVVLGACALFFVAQWPRLSREAYLTREAAEQAGTNMADVPSIQALMGINFFTFIFMAPLIFYAVAGISGLVLRLIGITIPHHATRLALFWALFCTVPLMLLHGLLSGFLGPVTSVTAVGVVVALAFFWLWFRLVQTAIRFYASQGENQVAGQ